MKEIAINENFDSENFEGGLTPEEINHIKHIALVLKNNPEKIKAIIAKHEKPLEHVFDNLLQAIALSEEKPEHFDSDLEHFEDSESAHGEGFKKAFGKLKGLFSGGKGQTAADLAKSVIDMKTAKANQAAAEASGPAADSGKILGMQKTTAYIVGAIVFIVIVAIIIKLASKK